MFFFIFFFFFFFYLALPHHPIIRGFAVTLSQLKKQVLESDCFSNDLVSKWKRILAMPTFKPVGQEEDPVNSSVNMAGPDAETVTMNGSGDLTPGLAKAPTQVYFIP